MRCHSISLTGGEAGPELNQPKNILDYRDEKTLRAFIRSASSFRTRSAMPEFKDLSEGDLDAILSYLKWTKGLGAVR